MITFLLWMILFLISAPVALAILLLYPIIWLLFLPFRLFGFAINGVFELLREILLLPGRLVKKIG